MEVGPSAAPIIPIEAASLRSKPSRTEAATVAKIPNCAAAPKSKSLGLESSGPKSIIAPIPMNSKSGIASDASIPTLNNQSRMPVTSPIPDRVWFSAPDKGRLTRIAPNPIGSKRDGSSCFAIAR